MSNPIALYMRVSELLGPTYVPVDVWTGLDFNGHAPADASVAINAFLAQASEARPVKLIFDIGVGMMEPLYVANGHCTIEGDGWDTGIFMMQGANCHCVSTETGWQGNGAYPLFNPNTTPPSQSAKNIAIRNLFINGNRGNGTTGNSTTGDPKGITSISGGFNNITWFCGVNIINATNVTIDGVYTYNIPTFHHRLGNISNFKVQNCVFDGTATLSAINIDGCHVCGPATNFHITNNLFNQMTDDNVALNAPEGWGGDIQRWVVSDNVHVSALSFFRCYSKSAGASTTQWHVTDGAISNLAGTLIASGVVLPRAIALELDISQGPVTGIQPNAIDRIVINNVQAYATGNSYFMTFADSIGAVLFTNCKWRAINSGTWAYNTSNTSALKIGSLSFVNCEIYQDVPLGSPKAAVGAGIACTIDSLDLDVQLHCTPGSAFSNWDYVVDPTNVTINKLNIRRLDPTHWNALINGTTWTNLPAINGAGLLESGFQIPDAQIPNGTFYISNTSPNAGKVCLKNTAGAVVVIG